MQLKNIIPLAALLILSACNNNNKNDNKDAKPAMGMMNMMETIEISKSNPLVTLKLPGELKPYEQTELFAKVNSYVKQIRVDIGDKVIAGQTMVVLEAPEIASQTAKATPIVEAHAALDL